MKTRIIITLAAIVSIAWTVSGPWNRTHIEHALWGFFQAICLVVGPVTLAIYELMNTHIIRASQTARSMWSWE